MNHDGFARLGKAGHPDSLKFARVQSPGSAQFFQYQKLQGTAPSLTWYALPTSTIVAETVAKNTGE